MKQKLLFIFALLCAVAQGIQARTIDLATLTSSDIPTGVVAQNDDVLTGTLHLRIKVSIAAGASVTLDNATIICDVDDPFSGITCLGNATITLVGDNKVKGGGEHASAYCGIEIGPEGSTLTINGTGSLEVGTYGTGTGIGTPNKNQAYGNISIEGGTITATGGDDRYFDDEWYEISGAGIGAGRNATCGTITFKNCTVTARGGAKCAGIGKSFDDLSQYDCKCGKITIDDGAVITAYGGENGAGIGGGYKKPGCEIAIYSGSNVRAYGGQNAAGIGGCCAGGGPIWIDGGYVEAHGGEDGAGIGGGNNGNSGEIVINGGTIYAYGNGYGTGIGASRWGDVNADRSSISINGGFIHAEGGEDIERAIGGRDDDDYDANKLSFGSGMYVYAYLGEGFPVIPFYWYQRNSGLQTCRVAEIKPCEHTGQTLSYACVDDSKHRFFCNLCGINDEEHTGQTSCTKCNYEGTPQYAHYYEMVYNEQEQKYEYQKVATEIFKNSLFLPELKSPLPTDRVFVGWVGGVPDTNDDGSLKNNETLGSAGQLLNSESTEVSFKARYISNTLDLATVQSNQKLYNGMIVTGTLNTATYPVKITIDDGATVTLRNANISGVNNNSYSWAGITCEGNATIVLEGTNTVKGFYEEYPGLFVPATSILTIDGEGSLNASSNGFGAGIGGGYYGASCGVINIQGGNITAIGGKYSAGIGSSHRNSCSHIIVSGGTINATGGEDAAGIGSGWGGNGLYGDDVSSCGAISITNGVTSVTATKGSETLYSIGAGYNGTCGSVAIGNMVGAVTRSPYNYVPFADVADNSTKIAAFYNKVCDVTLYGRTLYKDGAWNTLCLPFDVTIGGSPLAGDGVTVMELNGTTSGLDSEGLLTINFTEVTSGTLTAGKPYIIKWNAAATNIESPVFNDVTVTNTDPATQAVSFSNAFGDNGQFVGSYSPLSIDDANIDEIIYLGANNTLGYASSARTLRSFRAHFVVPTTSTSGARAMTRSIVNFGDGDTTSLSEEIRVKSEEFATAAEWYSLDGRRLSGKPTKKGVYINNGRKVVIK